MKAYYFDNVPGDQRLPHFDPSLPSLSESDLKKIGVNYWFIPIDADGNWEQVSYLNHSAWVYSSKDVNPRQS